MAGSSSSSGPRSRPFSAVRRSSAVVSLLAWLAGPAPVGFAAASLTHRQLVSDEPADEQPDDPTPEDLSTLPLAPGEDPWRVLVKGGPALLPSSLENLGRSAQVTALRTQASAASAAATSGEVFARRDAEDTEDAAIGARTAAENTARAKKRLQEAIGREESARIGAKRAADAAESVYEQANTYVQSLQQKAEGIVANAGLDASLTPVYKGLQEWKMKVLYSPLKSGRIAGAKAALPYERALLKLEKQIGVDQQKATTLSNEARSMRSAAMELANTAVGKQAVGRTVEAEMDMARAHQMVDQAKQIEIEGTRLHEVAKETNLKIPLYVVAAKNAAQEAVHRYVPEYAKPPMGTGAFLRPPPTSVLLAQTGRSSLRHGERRSFDS